MGRADGPPPVAGKTRRRNLTAAEQYNEYFASDGVKRCRTCKRDLPVSDYKTDHFWRDGLRSRCMDCEREVARGRTRAILAWRVREPGKHSAHKELHKAIKDGLVVRPKTCSACGENGIIDGHHHDYSRPLDVEWLCRTCHTTHHHKERRANSENARTDPHP